MSNDIETRKGWCGPCHVRCDVLVQIEDGHAVGIKGDPELAKEYPLILIATGKFMPFYHSELRQIPSAISKNPDPITDIHPSTAMEIGISDGDWIWIETPRGKIKQRARLTGEVHPAMLRVQHGWWFPDMPAAEPSLHGIWQSNSNVLCPVGPEYCNVEVGGCPHTALLCRVYKQTD